MADLAVGGFLCKKSRETRSMGFSVWINLLNHNILVKYIFLRSSVVCNVHKLNSNIVRPGIICISLNIVRLIVLYDSSCKINANILTFAKASHCQQIGDSRACDMSACEIHHHICGIILAVFAVDLITKLVKIRILKVCLS